MSANHAAEKGGVDCARHCVYVLASVIGLGYIPNLNLQTKLLFWTSGDLDSFYSSGRVEVL